MLSDTTDDALRAYVEVVRNLGPAARVERAARMSENARRIGLESEQRRHPSLTRDEEWLAVHGRVWGEDLAARVAAHVLRTKP